MRDAATALWRCIQAACARLRSDRHIHVGALDLPAPRWLAAWSAAAFMSVAVPPHLGTAPPPELPAGYSIEHIPVGDGMVVCIRYENAISCDWSPLR